MTLSKFAETLPENYGLVLLTAVTSNFVTWWMAGNVEVARKKYEVKTPQMYHEESGHVFNCIQRAHQNTVESAPHFLALLLVGGLQYPKTSAAMGMMYLVGRVVYAKGYYSGDLKRRSFGEFGFIGFLVLTGGVVSLSFQNMGWWPFQR